MSNKKCSPDGFAAALSETLREYNDKVIDRVDKAAETVAEETNEEIKRNITFRRRRGDRYVKAFRIKNTSDKLNKSRTWHAAAPNYRLTHLLENGHAKRGGGRTQAYPHIKCGEELAKRRMLELVKEAVKG